ncbi:MAG: VOC family protein, partial [Acidobacteriota bacterium]
MQKITPFLMFNDKAGEAMEFYASTFENSKIVSKVPGPGGSVMGGTIEIEGQRINTFNGGPHFKFTSGISLFVSCETQDEIDDKYEKLSAGGHEDRCGWLVDKFGVSWQIIPPILGELLGDKDREKAN